MSTAPPVGTRIRAEGRIGLAYRGTLAFEPSAAHHLGSGLPAPLTLRGAPGLAQEWRLVTVTGRIDDVRKLGDRWRAEMLVAANRVVVVGQPGSGIAVTALVEGRMATVIGIVRRPYPTASDQRYAITPRTPADLRIVGLRAPSAGRGTASAAHSAGSRASVWGPPSSRRLGPFDADLIDSRGIRRADGACRWPDPRSRPDGLLLDDGTTVGLVVLRGAALEMAPLLEPEDAINATGHVEQLADGPAVTISRQYGSGGSEIAERVARALGWQLYDNAVVDSWPLGSGHQRRSPRARSGCRRWVSALRRRCRSPRRRRSSQASTWPFRRAKSASSR